MKKLFTLFFALLAFASVNAQLLTEDFSFSGVVLAANGWASTAATYTGSALSTGTGLTYAGFDGSAVGNGITLAANGEDLTKTLSTTQTTGTTYMTFMVNVTGATTTVGGYITGFTSGTTAPGAFLTNYNLRVFVKAVAGGIDFGVSRSSGTPVAYTGTTYSLNQTYLITCKYTFGTAAAFDDVASIYVHPSTPALTEPAAMSATFTSATAGADATSLMAIFVRQGAAADAITATLDGFRVATTWSMTIPVEMVSFSAKKMGTTNKLAWQTATERDNSHFDVQRSTDGARFQNIGQVKGAGTSASVKNYEFMDETPSTGTNYYRLQQVDANGKTAISKTVAVNANGKGSVKVFPTLATDRINVLTTSDKAEAFEIVNLVGQTVLTGRLTNASDISISQLAKGNYILKIAGDAVQFSKQ